MLSEFVGDQRHLSSTNEWRSYCDSHVSPTSFKFYEVIKPRRQEFDTGLTHSVNVPHGVSGGEPLCRSGVKVLKQALRIHSTHNLFSNLMPIWRNLWQKGIFFFRNQSNLASYISITINASGDPDWGLNLCCIWERPKPFLWFSVLHLSDSHSLAL